jgi:hypothetical protein
VRVGRLFLDDQVGASNRVCMHDDQMVDVVTELNTCVSSDPGVCMLSVPQPGQVP